MIKNQVDIITMGCSKNLVDSEILMKLFEENGYHCVHDSRNPRGEIVVVNTCGFINDAKAQSIETIIELGKIKTPDQKLFVSGCLSQRYAEDLKKLMPEICEVPEREGIRIHTGTVPEHSTGCVLVTAFARQYIDYFMDKFDREKDENEILQIEIC